LRPSSRAWELALTGAVALLVVGTAINVGGPYGRVPAGLLGAIAVAPLLVRRTRPYLALALILAAGVFLRANVALAVPAVIVVYAIAASRTPRAAASAAVALVAANLLHRLVMSQPLRPGDAILPVLECGAAIAFGLTAASRRATLDALRDRAERLDRERELLAERAVTEERLRLARELHDAVGHYVSLMVVQAQALGTTAGDDRVRRSTDGIADLGRQAMAELQRTLQLLRGAAERGPSPGLDGLDRLLEPSRAAGLHVDLAIEGTPVALAPTLDLSAYRIVQEALTNVRRHAPAAHVTVTVAYRSGELALTIADDGAGARGDGAGGHGIAGMRERTALFGGTLTAGPRPGRGFEVRAVLPYRTASA
jgi:signal transduction histidine kinase